MPTLALDALDIQIIVDNESDTLSSVDDGVPQIPELVRLAARVGKRTLEDGHECTEPWDHVCVACHGFSALITGRRGNEMRAILFDVGPSGEVWLENARRMELRLASIEALFLSHWHSDHSGGLPTVVGAIAEARLAAGLPSPIVDLHPDRPEQRGVLTPVGSLVLLAPEPTFEAIEAAGGIVARHSEAHDVADGFFYASGKIARQTEYETGLVGHHTLQGGTAKPDPLIQDERFIAARVQGRGVSVLSACSHAGIVNASLGAMEAFPGEPIDVVLGGYHLSGKAMESRIEATVIDLVERVRPRVVAPGHCTGWRAKAALARAFAPGRYGPSAVGTTYALRASR
jgi:7,8-dihydropterin-6-yl-methyl-4-(beta-D-ribofuranosyl)aminobenzene 5'-phosphate synthase